MAARQGARGRGARTGRAVLRAYMNLREMPAGPATVQLDTARRAGAAMDFALRIRRHGRVSIGDAERFATLSGTAPRELRLEVLPALEDAGLVILERKANGVLAGLEEQVGVSGPVLEQCADVWEALEPEDLERCAIQASDEIAYLPYALSDLQTLLEQQGHSASLHEPALTILRAVQLAKRRPSAKLGEDILFSPYLWGSDQVSLAEFLAGLPPNEREAVASIARDAADRPGVPAQALGIPANMLRVARKNGLLDLATVMTAGGAERQFSFPPGIERLIGSASMDANHERKLVTAHILNGHLYGHPGTGRINNPLVLVDALLSRGTVGPATAIRTDYPLLESYGIVRVERTGNRGLLHLVKEDVVRDARDLIALALSNPDAPSETDDPLGSLWLPGSFRSPEKDRHSLPEVESGPEAEVMLSIVEELQESVRGERA